MDEKGNNTEKKKYTVVDKRFDIDDIQPADAPIEDAPAAAVAPAAAEQPPAPPSQPEAPAEEAAPEAQGDEEERDYRIEDAVRLALGTLREQALFALGLIIKKNRPVAQDMSKVAKVTAIFNSLSDQFADTLAASGVSEADRPEPTIQDVVVFIFNMLNGQVMMHLGLVPNPVTNLSIKDYSQAKLGIDFCAALLDAARSEVEPELARQLDAVISDMRLAFVNLK